MISRRFADKQRKAAARLRVPCEALTKVMIRKFVLLAACALFGAAGLLADFTYEQNSRITGGALAGMMKLAGAFSKAAREPQVSSISVKGNRMVSRHADAAQVIDLDKETITDINFKNKTYSTITFAQMKQALDEMSRKLQQERAKSGEPRADIKFKASIKETGQTKQIQGMNTKQVLMHLDMEGSDKQTGQKASMQVLADMWMAPAIGGYEEVRSFYSRMAQKLAWSPGSMSFAGMMQPGMSEGMGELAKQASKLDGVPVLQITRMGSVAEGQDLASLPSQPQGDQPQLPSASEAAGNAAGSAAAGAISSRLGKAGALGGALGGLGGFGRKKKQQEEQAPAPEPPPQKPEAGAAPAQGGLLMELTSELTAFSSAPVESSRFEVPAGFKLVENEMVKRLEK
jgi:hypothetical protein